MFSWLLEVVNSGVVGDNVSTSNKADAVVRAQPNQIGMFFFRHVCWYYNSDNSFYFTALFFTH